MASQADQLALEVQWSLERLADGNEETQSQNAHFMAGIPSSQVRKLHWRKHVATAHHAITTRQAALDTCACMFAACSGHGMLTCIFCLLRAINSAAPQCRTG